MFDDQPLEALARLIDASETADKGQGPHFAGGRVGGLGDGDLSRSGHCGRLDVAGLVEFAIELLGDDAELFGVDGEFFGEAGLLQGGHRTATVRASATSEVISTPR